MSGRPRLSPDNRIWEVPGKPGEYVYADGSAAPITAVFPFAHADSVPLDEVPPGSIIVMRAMPTPSNIVVHAANEHAIFNRDLNQQDLHVLHMTAHVYGKFTEGAEHYHSQEISDEQVAEQVADR